MCKCRFKWTGIFHWLPPLGVIVSSKPVIRVGGVPEHFNLPWHRAIQRHEFDDLDVDVQFHEYPGGTGAMTSALADDELDVALLLCEGAVTNILRGHNHRLIKIYVGSPLIWGIHVAAASAITEVEEIQDKVFAISRAGSGSHLIAIVDAAERGWSTTDMKFSKVGNLDGAREKLAAGKVDVFLWERFTTQPLVDSGEFRRVGQREVPWPAFAASANLSVLEKYGAQLRQIFEIVDASCMRFKSNPDAIDIVSKTFNIKPDDTAAWFEHVRWHEGFDRPDETLQKLIGYLQKLDLVDEFSGSLNDVWREI